MMTIEKILQRIKMLFKERFVYSKDDLIMYINAVKNYPSTQINAALTQLVDDRSEYVADKYGRLGNIVNIGQLYMFQPLELKNRHISTYERRAPIPYKRDSLLIKNLEYNKSQDIAVDDNMTTLETLISDITEKYEIGQQNNVLLKRETDWYKIYGVEYSILEQTGLDKTLLQKVLVYHIIESLLPKEMMIIMNFVFNASMYDVRISDKLLTYIVDYFKEKTITQDDDGETLEGMIIPNHSSPLPWNLLIKDKDPDNGQIVWKDAKRSDILKLKTVLTKEINDFSENIEKQVAQFVGFMSQFKSENKMVFKVKNYGIRMSKGARCDQAPRDPSLRQLKDILKIGGYNDKYINLFDTKKKFQICILQELYLRYFEFNKKNGKTWFLSPVQAIILKL